MKKAIAFIVLVCYLTVSCGVIVNFHYCMHRLQSTQLFASAKKVCGKCGMQTKKSNGCCHDEVKIVKLQQDQQPVQIHFSSKIPDVAISFPSLFLALPFENTDGLFYQSVHPPPVLSSQDTYLQNCVFRI